MLDSKICNRCRVSKPLDHYYYRSDQHRYVTYCKKCIIDMGKTDVGRERKCRAAKKHSRKLKIETMNAYGGCFCNICNENDLNVLTIDHVNNDGWYERRLILKGANRAGNTAYAYLRKMGYPAGYQVLCFNCNMAKHRNNGENPLYRKRIDFSSMKFISLEEVANGS